MKVKLTSIVPGTTSNADAVSFYLKMEQQHSKGEKLVISLDDCPTLSSSFLNSSIGAFLAKYGIDSLRKTISFVDYKPSQINYIKTYVEDYTKLVL